jgi:hypothetical protein
MIDEEHSRFNRHRHERPCKIPTEMRLVYVEGVLAPFLISFLFRSV